MVGQIPYHAHPSYTYDPYPLLDGRDMEMLPLPAGDLIGFVV